MINCTRTSSDDKDFQKLVAELDAYLRVYDGEDHAFYSQYNKIDNLKYVVVAYENDIAVGCGAMKQFADDSMEIKRMYVLPDKRAEGVATTILNCLEKWAMELNYKRSVLETGEGLTAAIGLYNKNGYKKIPNFGQYENIETSKCFEKILSE